METELSQKEIEISMVVTVYRCEKCQRRYAVIPYTDRNTPNIAIEPEPIICCPYCENKIITEMR